ncbi:MAG: HEAT repeat domain-containing protein [Calditrichia bacterium]
MKILLSFLFVSTFIFSCSRSNQEVFREMKELEYQRNSVSARFSLWLRSDNPTIREKAVESLGKIQDTSTISWVADKLKDPDVKVRGEAAFAMGQFFSPNAEPPLLNALDSEKNPGVKSRLIEALGKTGTEKSFPVLENLLNSQVPDDEKNAALSWGLISYRGYSYNQGLKNLNKLLKSTSDPEVQWRAAYALYRSGSPAEMNTLYEILKNNSPFARYIALKSITDIAGILKSSESEGFNYLESARNADRILQSPDFLQTLQDLMGSTAWYVKFADLQLVGALSNPSLWPLVKDAAADENPYIRGAALEAIADYKNQDAENFLMQYIQN